MKRLIASVGKDSKHLELPYIVTGDVTWYNHFGKLLGRIC